MVRKVLVGYQIIDSPLIRRISELRAAGMPQKDIAVLLGKSDACINANTPYERGMMIEPSKTINAQRVRDCRAKKHQTRET